MNRIPRQPQTPKSAFQKFKESPMYTIAVHTGLFAAGVFFIQSPMMEMLVPDL
ncbi:hypothetical protein BABINDRAFT_160460 [Babjeviella inositovora NRRL Y-12698]|uniref:Uncharacterized protein n=1 Tax=Babjeviella inositovora NRRL Y-12698 TaxID=984486 RepID=A0A1E3QTM7_9ASCO|nr:uncharacterized protein BABINDRAFT_160460 [Babjeviella inositovora NRRL Y-12698]ODQ81043.1 hypothetical protein BABINDRAFT_160460 [Babjeviella inositovora NRRL Y-12698]